MGDPQQAQQRRCDLSTLVSNYHKLADLAEPYVYCKQYVTSVLAWTNVTTSSLTLLLLCVLLLYPGYLQCVVVGVVGAGFGVGYLRHLAEKQPADPGDLTDVNPQDYINPQYYSLQPAPTTTTTTIDNYKAMLLTLDTLFRDLVRYSEVCSDILYWRDARRSGVSLLLLLAAGVLPSLIGLNYVVLLGVIYAFCGNTRFVALVTKLLDKRGRSSEVPGDEAVQQAEDFDSESDCDVEQLYRYFSFEDTTCSTCSKTVACTDVVKCYFCSSEYCDTCCGNVVTKETLGVTNPYTKDDIVKVCSGCFASINSNYQLIDC